MPFMRDQKNGLKSADHALIRCSHVCICLYSTYIYSLWSIFVEPYRLGQFLEQTVLMSVHVSIMSPSHSVAGSLYILWHHCRGLSEEEDKKNKDQSLEDCEMPGWCFKKKGKQRQFLIL